MKGTLGLLRQIKRRISEAPPVDGKDGTSHVKEALQKAEGRFARVEETRRIVEEVDSLEELREMMLQLQEKGNKLLAERGDSYELHPDDMMQIPMIQTSGFGKWTKEVAGLARGVQPVLSYVRQIIHPLVENLESSIATLKQFQASVGEDTRVLKERIVQLEEENKALREALGTEEMEEVPIMEEGVALPAIEALIAQLQVQHKQASESVSVIEKISQPVYNLEGNLGVHEPGITQSEMESMSKTAIWFRLQCEESKTACLAVAITGLGEVIHKCLDLLKLSEPYLQKGSEDETRSFGSTSRTSPRMTESTSSLSLKLARGSIDEEPIAIAVSDSPRRPDRLSVYLRKPVHSTSPDLSQGLRTGHLSPREPLKGVPRTKSLPMDEY